MWRQGMAALQQVPTNLNDLPQQWFVAVNDVRQRGDAGQLHRSIEGQWITSISQMFVDPRFLFLCSMRELNNTVSS